MSDSTAQQVKPVEAPVEEQSTAPETASPTKRAAEEEPTETTEAKK